MLFVRLLRAFFAHNRPTEFSLSSLETSSTNPQVDALVAFRIIRMSITAAFSMFCFQLRKTFAVVANAGIAQVTMIVVMLFMSALPTRPSKRFITPGNHPILQIIRE
jgi:hypothetical protein